MSIEQIVEEIANYLSWAEAQPFGAPIDTNTYRNHLEMERLLGRGRLES